MASYQSAVSKKKKAPPATAQPAVEDGRPPVYATAPAGNDSSMLDDVSTMLDEQAPVNVAPPAEYDAGYNETVMDPAQIDPLSAGGMFDDRSGGGGLGDDGRVSLDPNAIDPGAGGRQYEDPAAQSDLDRKEAEAAAAAAGGGGDGGGDGSYSSDDISQMIMDLFGGQLGEGPRDTSEDELLIQQMMAGETGGNLADLNARMGGMGFGESGASQALSGDIYQKGARSAAEQMMGVRGDARDDYQRDIMNAADMLFGERSLSMKEGHYSDLSDYINSVMNPDGEGGGGGGGNGVRDWVADAQDDGLAGQLFAMAANDPMIRDLLVRMGLMPEEDLFGIVDNSQAAQGSPSGTGAFDNPITSRKEDVPGWPDVEVTQDGKMARDANGNWYLLEGGS